MRLSARLCLKAHYLGEIADDYSAARPVLPLSLSIFRSPGTIAGRVLCLLRLYTREQERRGDLAALFRVYVYIYIHIPFILFLSAPVQMTQPRVAGIIEILRMKYGNFRLDFDNNHQRLKGKKVYYIYIYETMRTDCA